MAMSSSLKRILNAATTLAGELQHSQVQPLHLVAAILAEESSQFADILKEYREKPSLKLSEASRRFHVLTAGQLVRSGSYVNEVDAAC